MFPPACSLAWRGAGVYFERGMFRLAFRFGVGTDHPSQVLTICRAHPFERVASKDDRTSQSRSEPVCSDAGPRSIHFERM